jgi:signal transduction histidine kinase
MTARTARLVARAIAVATLLMTVGALGLTVGDRFTDAADLPYITAVVLGMAGLAIVGMILATRAPTNPIGWLFGLVALSATLAIVASQYAIRGLTDFDFPGITPATVISELALGPAFALLLTAFLLFPDGRLPGPRWRLAEALLWGSTTLVIIGLAFGTETFFPETGLAVANPLIWGPDRLWEIALTVGAWGMIAGGALALASVIVRFRRSHGEERQQLRWLAWASVLIIASTITVLVTGISSEQGTTANDIAFLVLVASVTLALPVATAVAVLRYRLYDLDLVVKKTAIYSIVAIALIALYLIPLALTALAGFGPVPALVIFALTFNVAQRRARRIADRIVYGRRATPFEVLSEFSERVGETYSVDDVLPRMTQLLAASTGAREVRGWVRAGTSLRSAAVSPADAPEVADMRLIAGQLPPSGDGVHAFPVSHGGELLGAITLTMAPNDPMDPSKERLANGVASQAGLALQNVRLVEELRASRRRIVAAQDARAKTLERNIHDGAQQQLVALTVKLRLAEQLAQRDPSKTAAMLRDLQTQATTTLEDLRDLARGIYPPLLADKGLPAAVEAQTRKASTPVNMEADHVGRYAPEIEATVYFCVLEALTNVSKYADAPSTAVSMAQENGELRFAVHDDGLGFDLDAIAYGTGLQGMADRLAAVGGSFFVESRPGQGTTVSGRVPVA